ncbi:hypothetical protein CC86DRAFT_440259 [Ophiobolus disseminans]|uniref:Uncharacterized protein n=1 Tax=Ophiobolus disseminans TaxID=1469910 RepID=A0A6A7A3M8_9PLEO|nr:hypothetical protein CC86DRAFT_440259 [Ophiobolus disseminans]
MPLDVEKILAKAVAAPRQWPLGIDATNETANREIQHLEQVIAAAPQLQRTYESREKRVDVIIAAKKRMRELGKEKRALEDAASKLPDWEVFNQLRKQETKWRDDQTELERLREKRDQWEADEAEFTRLQDAEAHQIEDSNALISLRAEKAEWDEGQIELSDNMEQLEEDEKKWKFDEKELIQLRRIKREWETKQSTPDRLQASEAQWQTDNDELVRLRHENAAWDTRQLILN